MNTYVSLARDRDGGRIHRDPETGRPRIAYTPSKFDRKHIMAGIVGLAKILHDQGALEIHACLPGVRPFVRTEASAGKPEAGFMDSNFQDRLKELEAAGNATTSTTFMSAHQMGSCRMSKRASDGVVDEAGRVWGVDNLYIADASVLPSASGVNPMITVMATADWISQGLANELSRQYAKL
jgi:choline dehydrogenase-like flavoprotein